VSWRKFSLFLVIFLSCHSTQNSNKDRIKPYAKNSHYWQYKGQPILLVGGTVDDNLFQLPHLKSHLDSLVAFGGNYIRNTMSSRVVQGFEVYRFKRLAEGKYDLDQWNDDYWQRFQNLLQWCYERDIIIQIEVWDRFDYARQEWLPCPWNPANNINYTFEETGFSPEYPNHPSRDNQPFFHSPPSMDEYQSKYDVFRFYQEKYIDKMLSYSLDYANVLYCMNNETSTSRKWGQYWMGYIKSKAAEKSVEVYVTDMFDNFWRGEDSDKVRMVFDNPDIYEFADISQVNSRNFDQLHWDRVLWLVSQANQHPRPCNHTKIYGSGFTSFGSGSPQDGVERFWRNLFAGSASSRFHRPPSGNGLNELAQGSLRAIRKLESIMKMWDVQPALELLTNREDDEAYLVSSKDGRFALYFTNGGAVDVDLSTFIKPFTLQWINAWTGEWAETATIDDGKIVTIAAPSDGGWVAAIAAAN
jgi:hypothetical protein